MAFDILKLVRPNIAVLKPYSSAKDEYVGTATILLDANENTLGSPLTKWYNRYPDPYQKEIKEKLNQETEKKKDKKSEESKKDDNKK